ncbi:MAG TPA: hypothetical protein VK798_07835 [Alloacidobacterium sp.]|nr:hypothetical protein [Alloacidobacterium sp.]
MKTLSAADALGPAFRRLREVMAAPFRLGFFLKIALVAALTQPSFYSVIISYPVQGVQIAAGAAMRHPGRTDFAATDQARTIPQAAFAAFAAPGAAAGFAVFAVMLLIGLLIWVLATYLFCRARFTLFDLVVYRHGNVRDAWGKYGRQTWRYFGIVLLASLVFLILLAAVGGPFLMHMLKTIRSVGPQAPNANPWPIFAQMLPFFGVCALLVLVWILVDAILQDFILPPMAIEDAPIEGAFARWFALLRSDAGSVLVYLLLRFVVALGMSWVLMMVSLFVLLILGMGSFAVGFGLYHAMWQGGFGMQMVFGAIVAVMILVLLTLYLLAMVAVYGSTAVFKQAYAAYFFGSRYQELGDRLEPPAIESDAGVSTEPPLPALPPLNEPPPVW